MSARDIFYSNYIRDHPAQFYCRIMIFVYLYQKYGATLVNKRYSLIVRRIKNMEKRV